MSTPCFCETRCAPVSRVNILVVLVASVSQLSLLHPAWWAYLPSTLVCPRRLKHCLDRKLPNSNILVDRACQLDCKRLWEGGRRD